MTNDQWYRQIQIKMDYNRKQLIIWAVISVVAATVSVFCLVIRIVHF